MSRLDDARDRMIVALDVADTQKATALVSQLGDSVSFYKIGMELVYGGGLDFARDLAASGKKVFLDLKLHDIPNTVKKAAAQVSRLGMTYLTVHAFPQTMKAALEGTQGTGTKILGVTVMTSYDDSDLATAGYAMGVKDLVARRAQQAKEIGIGGLILSAEEVTAMRALIGSSLDLVTPGIRPAGAAVGDQKRVMTPGEAIKAGATRLVIGRPITDAQDPKAAADAVAQEIAAALG
ncbi:orotidine-5'-phosphate decarboxylase [Rhizobiales bacterium TNE-4]|nr:orotidine-5'-phosphate decarboxylase [Rhizobiales bacterium TNE-4]MBV1828388.1 orotidine-5'-phosphate decarboxylase [Rhizobiales bacterium TNE-4]